MKQRGRVIGAGGVRVVRTPTAGIGGVLVLVCASALGEVVTDGSMGPQTSLGGPDFVISEDLGSRAGANLFHSFQSFNVDRGQSATFTGGADIGNVVSRVTGDGASRINGLLRSQIPNADFYFINPNGVVFGADARVDVPAAFHVSTGDELRFADGAKYSAVDPQASTLSVAQPESFGFLGNRSASIQISGSRLQFASSKTATVSAGAIEISDAALNSSAGEIRLVTSAEAGAVPVQVDEEQVPVAGSGSLSLTNSSVRVEGNGGGRIEVRTGDLQLGNSTLQAENVGDQDATEQQGIFVAADSATIEGSVIQGDASGSGQGANIAVLADDIAIRNNAGIFSDALDSGAAGAILLSGKRIELDGGAGGQAVVSSDAISGTGDAAGVVVSAEEQLTMTNGARISSDTRAGGKGGGVFISAGQMSIDTAGSEWYTGVSSDALSGSEGDAGVVSVTVQGQLDMRGESRISSNANGTGHAGNILVVAGAGVTLQGAPQQPGAGAGITSTSTSATGNAGNILVNSTGPVALRSGGFISTDSRAGANAGIIAVQSDSLSLHGEGNTNTDISSNLLGESGQAGGIGIVTAGAVTIDGGASIVTNNTGSGESLGVIIEAGSVTIQGDGAEISGIGSRALGSGDAGVVSVTARETVQLTGAGARISTDTSGAGEGGKIQVIADRIQLTGGDPGSLVTGITSDALAGSSGNAGLISIKAVSEMRVEHGAHITSDTSSSGNAGGLAVEAGRVVLDGDGYTALLTSNTLGNASGNGGEVAVLVGDSLEVRGGGRIGSDTSGSGDGGDVLVGVIGGTLLLDGEGATAAISSNARTGATGNAGSVEVAAPVLEIRNGGGITSETSGPGRGGDVNVAAVQLTIDGRDRAASISSNANVAASGNAGRLAVTADTLEIRAGGSVTSDSFGSGNSGAIDVQVTDLYIESAEGANFTGISSDVLGASGDAGRVQVSADNLISLKSGAAISSDTYGSGDAGDVEVAAKDMLIEGNGLETGISSNAREGASGGAGSIAVNASGNVSITKAGSIASDTEGAGAGGDVRVNAGTLLIDGEGEETLISTLALAGANGNAGKIDVTANLIDIRNGGAISSDSFSAGRSGAVDIRAGSLSIDVPVGDLFTGISSDVFGESGDAGRVQVQVDNQLSLRTSASISSDTYGSGNAGDVVVLTGDLLIDGNGYITGLSSIAREDSTGAAGSVVVNARNNVQILRYGRISSDTEGLGASGDVQVEAGNLLIDGMGQEASISTSAFSASQGSAGQISVNADTIDIRNGGVISSDSFSAGRSGAIDVHSNVLSIDGVTGQVFTGISSDVIGESGDAGRVRVAADSLLALSTRASISSDTYGVGNAGNVEVVTGDLYIDGNGFNTGISSNALEGATGAAGTVDVVATNNILMSGGARIASNTQGPGAGGNVRVQARNLLVEGLGYLTPISTAALAGSTGNAGEVRVEIAEQLLIGPGGRIANDTFGGGNAGGINVQAGELLVSGSDARITSGAVSGSQGDAGNVVVLVTGDLLVENGAEISSDAAGAGSAGLVSVTAGNAAIVGGEDGTFATVSTTAEGAGGDAGAVLVQVDGRLEVLRGGRIRSDTINSGSGGAVLVEAAEVLVDGRGFRTEISTDTAGDSGDAGTVIVTAGKTVEILGGGVVSSTTGGTGNAGTVLIDANNMLIDGSGALFAGVNTGSSVQASGDAGGILLEVADTLTMRDAAVVSSSTFSAGRAGQVYILADRLVMQGVGGIIPGILSLASEESGGQAGSIGIAVRELEMSNASILIDSDPFVPVSALPGLELTSIDIVADRIAISGDSFVSAASFGNVPASAINIRSTGQTDIRDSRITTEANQADGGPIMLDADILVLRRSKITTSVIGQGDGGDIDVNAGILVMDTGFIQANTGGQGASGGDIRVDGEALVASQGNLITGGDTPISFQPGVNVIQAAAPDGVSGNINLASPELDVSGSLVGLTGDLLILEGLESDPCAAQTAEGSSLALVGRGALPTSAAHSRSGLNPQRLKELLEQAPPESESKAPQPESKALPSGPKTSTRSGRSASGACARR